MSQQREELFKGVNTIANSLRGSVDGWDFKQYVLGALFYRYLSESLEYDVTNNEKELGNETFSYLNLKNSEVSEEFKECIKTDLKYYIAPEDLFANVVKNGKDNKDLNEQIARIFESLEGSVDENGYAPFEGLFAEFNVTSPKLGADTKEQTENLYKLLEGINSMELGSFKDNEVDAFGDVYENLMTMYASNAGRSGGEYFTPQEVSELVAKLAMAGRDNVDSVYDPTCGSGSLLLKFAKYNTNNNLKYYGQELNVTTYNLARMNMFLHGIDPVDFDIKRGDTLCNPLHEGKDQFDAIVSNPPYGVKWKGDTDPTMIYDPRFAPAGVLAPNGKGDFAFVLHALHNLKTDGTAAIVVFPGILYRDKKEETIRKYLIENNFIDTVIELPANLFYGTNISTNIIVLKKNRNDKTAVTFVDASKEFITRTKNNKLTDENIANILSYVNDGNDIEHLVKIASLEDIRANKYNLSVNKYVEKEDITNILNVEELDCNIDNVMLLANEFRNNIKNLTKVEKEEQE